MKMLRLGILAVCVGGASLISVLICPSAVSSARTRDDASAPRGTAIVVSSALAITTANLELQIYNLINDERRAKNLGGLIWDDKLGRMARRHSEYMARYGFFDHHGPDGGMLYRARASHIRGCRALGENLAYNLGFDDPAAFAVKHWIKSEGHLDNILRPNFTHTGVGVALAPDGRIFFTQVFAAK